MDRPTAQIIRRYERERPGELVHVDVKKLGRILDGGGHKNPRPHSRPPDPRHGLQLPPRRGRRPLPPRLHHEIHGDEKVATCAAFLTRAATFFAEMGITRIERVLTDNASAYRKGLARKAALDDLGTSPHRTPSHFWEN